MKPISLDCLTLPDATPIELIEYAAQTGYGSISLWVQPPALFPPMLATPAMARDIASALAANGIALGNLEVFNINSDHPVSAFEDTLAFGAALGAQSATAINFGPHRSDIAERLAAFHKLCARLGMATYVEPISMGATRTLADGVALIDAAGVDARLVLDCLHLIRTGGSPESIAAIAPATIGYVQLCDGLLAIAEDEIGVEATANRLYPCEGEFPLAEILRAVPAAVQLGVEVPSLDRQKQGQSPLQRAKEAMAATRGLLKRVESGL
ncbi:MAG: hypothetical protein E6R09_18665 [Rhodocyclaceae bacterium]|nr:MAG: hypothetical protein E6R09_18665 [Rhodocyclaceae bacterium]